MAKEIKETPILRGRDAKRFYEEMEKAKTEVIPQEEKDRIKANAEKLKAISKF